MKKSAYISDVIFTFFVVFISTICIFRYLSLPLWGAFLLAFICGGLGGVVCWAILSSKRNAYFLKKSEEAQKEKLLVHLALLSPAQSKKILVNALQAKLYGNGRFTDEERLYFTSFRFAPVTADEISAFSRWKTQKKRTVLCNEIAEDAARLCARLGIDVQTGEQVYLLLKEKNALPDEYLGQEAAENKKLRRKKLCFAKRNSRRFLVGGCLVLLSSLLTPFPYYYLLCGIALIAAAVFVRIFGYS